MDLEMLATMVDDLVHVPGADRLAARLYGVRIFGGSGGGSGGEGGRILLDELARGYAREIPRRVRPPAGLAAIALTTTGWGAPLEDDGTVAAESGRPSLHPQRRRIHVTALVAGQGEDCSVIRFGDDDPVVVRGAIGYVHELLLRCWSRRLDAPESRVRRRPAMTVTPQRWSRPC